MAKIRRADFSPDEWRVLALSTTEMCDNENEPGRVASAGAGSDQGPLLWSNPVTIPQATGNPSARQPLSKRARFEVFKRDGFACQYCGQHPPNVMLEVDHITPVAEGGGSEADNLVTACFNCNRGKAYIPLSVVPKSLPEKAAEVEEMEAQLAGYREVMQARADRIEDDMWTIADELVPDASRDGMRRDWLQSIKTFNTRLSLHDVKDAAFLARARLPYSDRRRFLYFCKVCWSKIKEPPNG